MYLSGYLQFSRGCSYNTFKSSIGKVWLRATMGAPDDILLGVLTMDSYEEYVTGLIYFRNELEALIESWPRTRDGKPLPTSSCAQQDKERFLARLRALISGYEYTTSRYALNLTELVDTADAPAEPRPAGLPSMPEADRLEQDVLAQIEQLLADLLSLKAEVGGSGKSQRVPALNRTQWLVSYLADWR